MIGSDNMAKLIDRIGEINHNNYNNKMIIIDYNSSNNVIVKFEDGAIKKCDYRDFKNGSVVSPYDKTVMKVGRLGEGKYKIRENNKPMLIYTQWRSMIQRCYSPLELEKRPTYRDCTICEEWLNFQNFAKWYENNYYTVNDEIMNLDKDILHKGNKIYSPNNCIFTPKDINTLIVKNDAVRGKYAIGTHYDKDRNKFKAQCTIHINGKRYNKNLGRYNTEIEAFNAYKKFKEQHIKEIADKYKPYIPNKLYEAMYNYKVEITD